MRASNKGFKPKSQHLANGGLVQNAAEYWSEDNAKFEKTNPGVGSRILRAVNPMTSFGSAMGAMQDSAQAGDGGGMALAAAQAIPVFGAMRAAGPLVKSATGFVPSLAKTGAAMAGSAAFGAGADTYQPQGFNLKNGNRQSFANGGMVKGAGTGTSDSIKKEVAVGSYIMPADSTKQIGAPSLGALGFKPQAKMPVNLSNGEYELPPEQVHAVGVQALDQMKGATHTPVQGNGAKGFKPEMFFANGGEVDPEKLKQPVSDVTRIGNSYSSNGSVGGNVKINGQQGDGGGVFGAIGTAANNTFASMNAHALPETSRVTSESIKKVGEEFGNGNYGKSIGAGIGGAVKAAGGLGYDLIARPIGGVAGFAGEIGKGIFGIEDSPAVATTPVTAKAPAVTPVSKNVPNPLAAGANAPTVALPQDTTAQTPTAPAPSVSGIIRNGNSFSDGRSVGVGADGITSANPQWNSKQNQGAKTALFGGTPELFSGANQGQGQSQAAAKALADPAFDVPMGAKLTSASSNYGQSRAQTGFNPNTTAAPIPSTQEGFNAQAYQASQYNAAQLLNARRQESNQMRENELRMIAPYSGSGGKLTVSQQAARQGLIAGMSAGDLPQYTTDVNNATGLRKQAMGDQAATERAAMQEQGANYRNDNNNSTDLTKFGATNDLANREFNSGADARGLQSQQARVMSKALAAYDAAKTPEEIKSASERLQQLNGKEQANRFTVVPGGQEYDAQAMAMVNRPGQVLNNQTGEFINQQASTPPIDRNPAVAKIVNDASLSVDEKRKQLQAMGYK